MATIVLVDDDPTIRQLIGGLLKQDDHDVHLAENAETGIELAKTLQPELVIIDIQMPGMDGYALARCLRRDQQTCLVPILFLSGNSSSVNRMRGYQLGADDFIPKESGPAEILVRIERVLATNAERRQQDDNKRVRSGFMGDLAEIGPASLLMMCEIEHKTGELCLTHLADEAILYLVEGRVIDASWKCDPSRAPTEVIYTVVGWTQGMFFLTPCDVVREDRVGLATPHLLMEVARRQDEYDSSGYAQAGHEQNENKTTKPAKTGEPV